MLKIKSFYQLSHISEPGSIVLVNDILAPVSVSREELSNFHHVLMALLLVLSPYLGLLSHQAGQHVLQLVLEL